MLPCGVNVRPRAWVDGPFGTFWCTMGNEIAESAETVPPKGTSLSHKGSFEVHFDVVGTRMV